jgi:hypothetical protein
MASPEAAGRVPHGLLKSSRPSPALSADAATGLASRIIVNWGLRWSRLRDSWGIFMQESSTPAPHPFLTPRLRIAYACFMFAVSALTAWLGFFDFNWVTYLCFGLLALVLVPRQKGEARLAYWSKPRNLVSAVLIIALMCSTLHAMYLILLKHQS